MPPRQWFNGLSKRAPAFTFPRQAAHLLNPREGRVIAAYFIIRPRSRPALSPSFVLLAAALPRVQPDVRGLSAAMDHRAAAVL